MKKFLPWALALLSTGALANDIQFNNLTTKDIENVAREFSANFVHTGVSAPETDGVWGIEVGVIAGRSKSPDLSDVIQASGGNGSDFETLYHAAVMARAHFPFDLFAEMTILPEREISEVTIKSNSFEIGWNAGAFFNLPLDIAIGLNRSNSEISFSQTQPVQTDISLESKTTVMWVGVSKTFLFVTPYLKFGAAKAESDFASTADILVDTNELKESVDNSGGYLAFGANLQFAFFKIGAEISKVMDVGRASGKISLDF
jgi:hypothetical protein